MPYTPVPCFREKSLEPYVMVKKWKYLPLFDERFINYGCNKVQWIEHLRYKGYEYNVLSHGFAEDMPHPKSHLLSLIINRSVYAHFYLDGLKTGDKGLYYLYMRFLYDMRYNERDESRILLCLTPKK